MAAQQAMTCSNFVCTGQRSHVRSSRPVCQQHARVHCALLTILHLAPCSMWLETQDSPSRISGRLVQFAGSAPIFKVDVQDTTGTGDVFTCSLVACALQQVRTTALPCS